MGLLLLRARYSSRARQNALRIVSEFARPLSRRFQVQDVHFRYRQGESRAPRLDHSLSAPVSTHNTPRATRADSLTGALPSAQNDLTLASYLSHLSHASSDAPLTAREQEMAEIRAAEAKEQREGSAQQGERRSMLVSAAGGAAIGLEWSEEAKGAVEELAGKDSVVVQLVSWSGVEVGGGC